MQPLPPPPAPGNSDRMLMRKHFESIQKELKRPFTLDAACNDSGDNALCERYCSPSHSFLSADCAGEHVWCNPPYTPAMLDWVRHYMSCKEEDPANTSGMFLVPKWPNISAYFEKGGFRLFKEYPMDTVLFTAPNACGVGRHALPGIPWPAQLWYDPPRKFVTANATQLGVSYTMQFNGKLHGKHTTVLVDSGADCVGTADGFISREFLQSLGVPAAASTNTHVRLATNAKAALHGEVKLPISLNSQFRDEVRLLVLDRGLAGVDVILGVDCLKRRQGVMSWGQDTLTLQRGGKSHTLTPAYAYGDPSSPQAVMQWVVTRMLAIRSLTTVNTISAKAAAKAISRGARVSIIMVREKPPPTPDESPITLGAAQGTADTAPASTETVPSTAMDALLKEFHDVFQEMSSMPPDRGVAHSIPLETGAVPPGKRMYRLSPREREEVETQIKKLLAMGFIQPSTSPYGAPVLFVDKPDGSLRMCLDYRALNKITIKRRYPMPNIQDLFDQLQGAKVFSSLDLQQGYYQIRIPEEDVPKTAFLTHLGQYEYKVLCMGLTNAPATFQELMNKVFAPYIGKFVLVYLDDIMVYSKTPEDHVRHLRLVLEALRKHKLYAKMSKCDFNKLEVKFLGHIVSREGLRVDPKKVKTVQEWPVPPDLPRLRSFLGLANYFRRFILGYSTMVSPLTSLTGSKVKWEWTPECQKAFEAVKHALTHAPVLALPDLNKPFTVISDASIYGTGAVLMQDDRVVAYTSQKLSAAEHNYSTTDQECLGVITALEEWRCYLEGTTVTLITDHQPLTYLQQQRGSGVLSRRQARWMELLSKYHFQWEYRPGRTNVADPLSRIHTPVEASVLWPVLTPTLCALTRSVASLDVRERIKAGYADDPLFADPSKVAYTFNVTDSLWYKGSQVVVPDVSGLRTLLISEFHDGGVSGHRGTMRTIEAIKRGFWWTGLDAEVTQYIAQCPKCQRNKASTAKPSGLLQSLPIPSRPWQSISMDFIVRLPMTKNGYDSILVFVDRLTKMTHFVPTRTNIDAEEAAQLFLSNVFRHHGLPDDIVSDRDPKFTGHFWKALFKGLQTKLKFSTAFHPQTDGQTERMNRVLEEALRSYIGPKQDDWDEHLPLIEFAVNSSKQASTGYTPFALNGLTDPRVPANLFLAPNVPKAERTLEALHARLAHARQQLQAAQQRDSAYANNKRRDVTFAIGDKVLLSTKNIRQHMKGPDKLQMRYIGPFRIAEKIGSVSYKLELPLGMKMHPVFHVSLLKQWNEAGGHQPPAPTQFTLDGEPYYTVEKVLDHKDHPIHPRSQKLQRMYLIKWEGYAHTDNSWEPDVVLREDSLVEQMIEEYLESLAKPKRPSRKK